MISSTNLYARLAEADPSGELLPDEGVGVVGALKDPLQCRQLRAGEGGPVTARLPLGRLTVLVVYVMLVVIH